MRWNWEIRGKDVKNEGGSGASTGRLSSAVEAAEVRRAEEAREVSRVRGPARGPRGSLTAHRHLLNPRTGLSALQITKASFCSRDRGCPGGVSI